VKAISIPILWIALALPAAAQAQAADTAKAPEAAPPAAASLALDTSKNLRCAIPDAAECDESAECSGVELAAVDLPDAWRVDFAGKQLTSMDGLRTSPIASVETLDEALLLQGNQNGRGWTLVVDRATGHLMAAAAGADGAFVLAGGCSAE
jgi:hypothetical protein